jgi:hypothetical protein
VIDAWFVNRYEDRPITREKNLTVRDFETHIAVAREEGAKVEEYDGFIRVVWEFNEAGQAWVYSEFYVD